MIKAMILKYGHHLFCRTTNCFLGLNYLSRGQSWSWANIGCHLWGDGHWFWWRPRGEQRYILRRRGEKTMHLKHTNKSPLHFSNKGPSTVSVCVGDCLFFIWWNLGWIGFWGAHSLNHTLLSGRLSFPAPHPIGAPSKFHQFPVPRKKMNPCTMYLVFPSKCFQNTNCFKRKRKLPCSYFLFEYSIAVVTKNTSHILSFWFLLQEFLNFCW